MIELATDPAALDLEILSSDSIRRSRILARAAAYGVAVDSGADACVLAFFDAVVESCAVAAERHARSFSDGDAGRVCQGAACAVRNVGLNGH